MKDNKIKIICPSCSTHFSSNMPVPEFSNHLRSSCVVMTHERPVRCICGQSFVPVLVACSLQWDVQPLSEEARERLEGSRIIKPLLTTAVN